MAASLALRGIQRKVSQKREFPRWVAWGELRPCRQRRSANPVIKPSSWGKGVLPPPKSHSPTATYLQRKSLLRLLVSHHERDSSIMIMHRATGKLLTYLGRGVFILKCQGGCIRRITRRFCPPSPRIYNNISNFMVELPQEAAMKSTNCAPALGKVLDCAGMGLYSFA